jgi:wobble nucleotide-excising tRNase
LGKYEETINAYLRRFGATFSITGTKPSWAGGKTSSTYKILLNDQPLDLGDARTPKGTPCFRTALSAGDKSTLALAFFLARLDREPALSDKVVVLDDPFSSLDQFRLACTQQAICELADRAEQVIVLSHNPFFLKHIYDACPKTDLKTLHVVRGRGSAFRLEEWDIGRACRPESDVAYFNLQTYLDEGVSGDGDLRAIAKEIRICLEGALRSRFPGHFAAHGMLGTFIDAIRNADGTSPLAVLKPKLQELEDLNGYARRYHHAGVPGGTSPQPDDDELQNFVTRALAFVHGGSVP